MTVIYLIKVDGVLRVTVVILVTYVHHFLDKVVHRTINGCVATHFAIDRTLFCIQWDLIGHAVKFANAIGVGARFLMLD